MSFTQFEASSPAVKPATQEVVYDKYWMKSLIINAEDSTKPVRMKVVFVPARDVTVEINGKQVTYKETMPNAQQKVLFIDDVFKAATTDLEFAATMDNVFKVIKKIATEKKIL